MQSGVIRVTNSAFLCSFFLCLIYVEFLVEVKLCYKSVIVFFVDAVFMPIPLLKATYVLMKKVVAAVAVYIGKNVFWSHYSFLHPLS